MKNIYLMCFVIWFCISHNTYGQVIEAEYFFDSDPGNGQATPLIALDGNLNSIVENIGINTTNLPSNGTHTLNIRVKDNNNTWGPIFTTAINVVSNTINARDVNVVQAEYFFDTDPGQGSGITLLALDGNFDSAIENIGINTTNLPSNGAHTLNIRVKDNNNTWGPIFTTAINVVSNTINARDINVVQAEYFFDTDPGQGSGITLLALDGNFDSAIENIGINTTNLPSNGAHTLNIRVKDNNNTWGPIFTTAINVISNTINARGINVVQAEYFFDTDPGQGSGITLLALDGNFDSAIENIGINTTSLPSNGAHTLNIRVKDNNNTWGPIFTTVINVVSNTINARDINVVQAEYFFDTDPGYGLAYPMIAIDGNFDSELEQISPQGLPSQLSIGLHTLYVRVKDANNTWGPNFATVVSNTTNITPNVIAKITGDTIFCNNSSLTNIKYTADEVSGATYLWTAPNGTILSGQGTDSIHVTWSSLPSNLTLKICQGSNCDSITHSITERPAQATTDNQVICSGSSYVFGSQTLTTAGTYNETFTDVNGCDSIVTLNLTVNSISPTITIATNDVNLCIGQNTTFNATATNGGVNPSYQWKRNGNNVGTGLASYNATSNNNGDLISCEITTNGICSTTANSNSITIVVNQPDATTDNQSICTGGSFTFGSQTLTTTGTYNETFTNINGCDSVVTLNLTVNSTSPTITVATNDANLCIGQNTTFNATITNGGTNPNYQWKRNGNNVGTGLTTYNASGNSNGDIITCEITTNGICATTVSSNSITIIVNQPDATTDNQSICTGDSYLFGSQTLTTAGTYNETFTNINGCDSVVSLNLTINSSSPTVNITTNDANLCIGQTTVFNATITNGGTSPNYQWKRNGNNVGTGLASYNANSNNNGDIISCEVTTNGFCAATVNSNSITIIVNQPDATADNQSICAGSSYTFGSQTLTSAGLYNETFTNTNGCDSIVSLDLTILEVSDTTLTEEICQGEVYTLGSQNITTSGSYTETLQNTEGCDSTVNLTLFVKSNPSITISQVEGDLTSTQGDSYQWFQNGDSIIGATNQSFTPSNNGTYSVTTTAFNGCSNSDSFTIINVGIATNEEFEYSIFPNPTNGTFNILSSTFVNTKVYNTLGQVIYHNRNNQFSINISDMERGVYFIKMTTDAGKYYTDKIILQ